MRKWLLEFRENGQGERPLVNAMLKTQWAKKKKKTQRAILQGLMIGSCVSKEKNVTCYSNSMRVKPSAAGVVHWQCTLRGMHDGEKQQTFYASDILALR